MLLKASFDPGWHAEVDGRPAPTVMLAPGLVGVEVPPGRHEVSFSYSGYAWYPLFFAITALTILALLLVPLAARRVGRAPVWVGPPAEPSSGWS